MTWFNHTARREQRGFLHQSSLIFSVPKLLSMSHNFQPKSSFWIEIFWENCDECRLDRIQVFNYRYLLLMKYTKVKSRFLLCYCLEIDRDMN